MVLHLPVTIIRDLSLAYRPAPGRFLVFVLTETATPKRSPLARVADGTAAICACQSPTRRASAFGSAVSQGSNRWR